MEHEENYETDIFGKGAIPEPQEITDSRYVLGETAPRPIDWATPFNVESGFVVPFTNQQSSSSCTAQATLYYCEALEQFEHNKTERYSRRFTYSQIWLPGGGGYIYQAMGIPVSQGCASLDSVPDENYSEAILRDKSLNVVARIEAIAKKYAQLRNKYDIEYLAQVCEDYKGFVTGFQGDGSMISHDGTLNPKPFPITFGHAIWVCGHTVRDHVNRAGELIHKDEKMLKYKNSWGSSWGDGGYGYIPECFVKNGTMFDAYVYAEIEDIDPITMPKFDLQRAIGTKDIFLVRDGKKSLVFNQGLLVKIADFSDVKDVSQSELDAIPTSGSTLAEIVNE